jgi:hypothetical protein
MGRLFLLTLAFAGLAIAAQPDFSGNWVLNLDKSNFGKSHKPDGMTLKVTRDGDNMHAVQTTNTPGGPTDVAGDWIVDGKQHDKTTTKWEGNTLVSERAMDDGTSQKIYLTLSSDGKTTTEKVITKGQDGSNTSTLVWERR